MGRDIKYHVFEFRPIDFVEGDPIGQFGCLLKGASTKPILSCERVCESLEGLAGTLP